MYTKELYKDLLEKAIGKDRNAYQFAVEIGIAPSTITRILKGNNKRASSRDVLELIAEHAAPGSNVTLEALLLANGLPLDDNMIDNRELYGILALQQALDAMDAPEYDVIENATVITKGLEVWHADFCINTKNKGVWVFDMMSTAALVDKFPFELDHKSLYERKLHQFVANMYLGASVNGEVVEKYSIVVGEEENYKYLAAKIKEIEADKCISVIYLKRDAMKLVEESVQEQCSVRI